MANFATNKRLAGFGSVLLFLCFLLASLSILGMVMFIFTLISCIMGICGLVLVLTGMKNLAKHYRDYEIYKKMRAGTIFSMLGLCVLLLMLLTSIFHFDAVSSDWSRYGGNAPLYLSTFAVSYVFMLLMAVYFRQSFTVLADRSDKQLFRTAGTSLLIGTIVTFALYTGICISALLTLVNIGTVSDSLFFLSIFLSISSSFFIWGAFILVSAAFFTLKKLDMTAHNYL